MAECAKVSENGTATSASASPSSTVTSDFEDALRARLIAWMDPTREKQAPELPSIPDYLWSDPQKVEFPTTLSAVRRVAAREVALSLELYPRSDGPKTARYMTVFSKESPEYEAVAPKDVGRDRDRRASADTCADNAKVDGAADKCSAGERAKETAESVVLDQTLLFAIEAKLILWQQPEAGYFADDIPGIPPAVWSRAEKLEFPRTLPKEARAAIRNISARLGLFPKSHGSKAGSGRQLVVWRTRPSYKDVADVKLAAAELNTSLVHVKDVKDVKDVKVARDTPAATDEEEANTFLEEVNEHLLTKLMNWLYSNEAAGCVPEVPGIPAYVWADPDSLTFPCTLHAQRRSQIHNLAGLLGMYHVSTGSKAFRQITVRRQKESAESDDSSSALRRKDLDRLSLEDRKSAILLESRKKAVSVEMAKPAVSPLAMRFSAADLEARRQLVAPVTEDSCGLHPLTRVTVLRGARGLSCTPGVAGESLEALSAAPEVVLVDTLEALRQAVAELRACSEVGFDAEMHNYRSYYGLTCTLQLIGRKRGSISWLAAPTSHSYVVDCIALWDALPAALGPLFADPTVLKIGFSLSGDAIYLYRDFGLVLINVICLQVAAELSGAGVGVGLAKMLAAVGGSQALVDAVNDGKEGLRNGDWRQRPLPAPMLEYAAGDVRFLIPAFHALMTLLLDQGREKVHGEGSDGAADMPQAAEQAVELAFVEYTFSMLLEEHSRLMLAALARSQQICIEKSVRRAPSSPLQKAREWGRDKLYVDFMRYKKAEALQSQQNPATFTPWTPLNDAIFARLYEWRELKAAAVDEAPSLVACVGQLLRLAERPVRFAAELRNALMSPSDLSPWMRGLGEEGLAALAEELFSVLEAAAQESQVRGKEAEAPVQAEREKEHKKCPSGRNEPISFYAMLDEAIMHDSDLACV